MIITYGENNFLILEKVTSHLLKVFILKEFFPHMIYTREIKNYKNIYKYFFKVVHLCSTFDDYSLEISR